MPLFKTRDVVAPKQNKTFDLESAVIIVLAIVRAKNHADWYLKEYQFFNLQFTDSGIIHQMMTYDLLEGIKLCPLYNLSDQVMENVIQ